MIIGVGGLPRLSSSQVVTYMAYSYRLTCVQLNFDERHRCIESLHWTHSELYQNYTFIIKLSPHIRQTVHIHCNAIGQPK